MIINDTVLLTGAQSKKTVISTLINHFCSALPSLDPKLLFDEFWQRESLGSTGIGHGVAIPHVRSEQAEQTHSVFIRLEQPVDFAGLDKQPVDLVMGMLFPQDNQQQNLVELKQVAEFFDSRQKCQLIRDAQEKRHIELLIMRNLTVEDKICEPAL